MRIEIQAPKNFEAKYGSSEIVRVFLDEIEKKVGNACDQDTIRILHISLLIAHPDEIAKGKFVEYEKFDWRLGYAAIGVNGDYHKYLLGDDLKKIEVIAQMLQVAFSKVSKKRKSNFNGKLANTIVMEITGNFLKGTSW